MKLFYVILGVVVLILHSLFGGCGHKDQVIQVGEVVVIEKNTWLGKNKDFLEKSAYLGGEELNKLYTSRNINKLNKGNKVKILKIEGDIIEVEDQSTKYFWKGYIDRKRAFGNEN